MWCEHCRDHYSSSHYDADSAHKAGAEYGTYGRLLACAAMLRKIAQDYWNGLTPTRALMIEARQLTDDT